MASKPATTLYELLKRQARRLPDATAIAAPGSVPLTYSGLLRYVNYIHTGLRSYGINHNDSVAIILPNGAQMAVAFLGVSSYCASAPLSMEHKREEYDYFLSRLQAKAIIVQTKSETPAILVAKSRGILVIELKTGSKKLAGDLSFEVNDLATTDNTDLVQS